MTSKEKRAIDQKEINELAKQYCEYRKSGNSGQMKALKNKLWLKICNKDDENNVVSRELFAKRKYMNDEDAYDLINDTFLKYIDEYDYDYDHSKPSYFIPYITMHINYACMNKDKKEFINSKSSDEKIPRRIDNLRKNNDGEYYDTDIVDLSAENKIYEKADEPYVKAIRAKLTCVLAKYVETHSRKVANNTRLSYFKIFLTEAITNDIYGNRNYDDYNINELYDTIDGNYVRFFAFTDFVSVDDLIDIKIKKYSDIIENGEEKEIELNGEPKVIIPYRVQAGLDKKAVSQSNVKQMKDEWENYTKPLFADL